MNKYLLLALALIAITLMACAHRAHDKTTETQIPTAHVVSTPEAQTVELTQTYESKEWGFSFKYPQSYTLNTHKDSVSLIDSETFEALKKREIFEGAPFITLSTFKNPEKLSILEWVKKDPDHTNFQGEYNDAKVGGKDAISYSWIGLGGGDNFVVISDDQERVYQFGVSYMDKKQDVRNIFFEIVKTIEFI